MHQQLYRRSVVAVLALALSACARHAHPESASAPVDAAPVSSASPSDSARVAREYRGSYTAGFEMSWFEPCDMPASDRLWWVTLTDDALRQRDSLLAHIKREPTTGLAVRWRGTISPRMRAGQMGRGTRYMLVTSVIAIRPTPSGGACTDRAT